VTVVFATCDPQPLVAPDDEPLVGALSDLGITVEPIPWTEIDPAAVVDASPIVLRSTWDYHRMPTMFAAWLEALDDSGRIVMNTPAIARANIDKIYLRDLESAGIPIPPTRWIDRPDAAGLKDTLREAGWKAAVIKPRIAATAYGTFLITAESELSEADLAPARASGALVQEFVSEIRDRGEISLVFAGAEFSHAVSKHALDGDFRVQQDFGGTVVETTPSAQVHALALQVMARLPGDCTYARIDIVETDRGPLLMELEVIEPELYFTVVPGSAATMARAIAARLP
jgi:glutathione synthase/RimK-type ligase-like ATP-grasp enzyme